MPDDVLKRLGARCMDCGIPIPFCDTINTKAFLGNGDGRLRALRGVRLASGGRITDGW